MLEALLRRSDEATYAQDHDERPVLDPATVRAWARATNRTVGFRGAIPAHLYNEYVVEHAKAALRRAALAAGHLALTTAPVVARAVAERRRRGQL